MKKQIVVLTLLLSCLSFPVFAQVGVSVNINVQPVWGPVGYDHADYYYIPDIETYFDVNRHTYTWFENGRWITDISLPPRYSTFDLYHAYKVVINEPNPWFHHDRYRRENMQFRGRHDQGVIRDSHDERYFANPGHPEHKTWQQGHREAPRDHSHDWEHHVDNHRDEHRDR